MRLFLVYFLYCFLTGLSAQSLVDSDDVGSVSLSQLGECISGVESEEDEEEATQPLNDLEITDQQLHEEGQEFGFRYCPGLKTTTWEGLPGVAAADQPSSPLRCGLSTHAQRTERSEPTTTPRRRTDASRQSSRCNTPQYGSSLTPSGRCRQAAIPLMRQWKKEAMEYETQLEICVSAAMNQIKNLSYGELKDLHENDAKIDAIIESLPQIRSLPNEKDMVLAQNKSFAECNLTLEPKLNEAKVELMANYEEAMKYKAEVETLKARLDAVSSKRSIDATCACLQAAVREAEDESEKLMEDLQMGKIEPDRFVDEFVRKKTLAHKRKIKSEKLMAIVNEQQMVMERRSSTRSVPYPDVSASNFYPNPRHSSYY